MRRFQLDHHGRWYRAGGVRTQAFLEYMNKQMGSSLVYHHVYFKEDLGYLGGITRIQVFTILMGPDM